MGAVTFLGGLPLADSVVQAMHDAYASKVDLFELNASVGSRIASFCGAEAGCVTSGAAGGLQLAAAACITRGDNDAIARLPEMEEGRRPEIVLHRKHRCNFDHAVRNTGARLVEFGYSWDRTERWELEAAFTERTAAVFYVTDFGPSSVLPLQEVVEVAHAREVPVIVDAAVSLPPRANLRELPGTGADLTSFSGGKAVGGPQNTGFLVGRRDLVDACVANASPNHNTIGRPAKVNAEAMVGLIVALEAYLERDEDEEYAGWTSMLERIREVSVGARHDDCELTATSKNGMPIPTLRYRWPTEEDAVDASAALRACDPAIWLNHEGSELVLDPHALRETDVDYVGHVLATVVRGRAQAFHEGHSKEDS
jgi:L-seryl-tRNA(Ser) seleniumtransferase